MSCRVRAGGDDLMHLAVDEVHRREVIEFDVQPTSDGHLVVLHDLSLERTASGSGPLFAAGIDEVRALDAGSWFGVAYAGAQVPFLSEVLALDDIDFELELEGYGESFVVGVLDSVEAAGVLKRVESPARTLRCWHC